MKEIIPSEIKQAMDKVKDDYCDVIKKLDEEITPKRLNPTLVAWLVVFLMALVLIGFSIYFITELKKIRNEVSKVNEQIAILDDKGNQVKDKDNKTVYINQVASEGYIKGLNAFSYIEKAISVGVLPSIDNQGNLIVNQATTTKK